MIFIQRAVEIVGATLGHQIHLRPGRTAGLGIGIARGYPKFLQGVQGGAQGAFECRPLCLIVVVNAIQGDVGLVAAGAAHRPRAAVEILVNFFAHENYSGLQAKNARRIAAFRLSRSARSPSRTPALAKSPTDTQPPENRAGQSAAMTTTARTDLASLPR